MLKYYLDKTGKVIKSILFPSSEFVDTEPREGSLNPLASGAVANIIPQDAAKDNPLMTAADTERMVLEKTTPAVNTLRFSFSKLDYSPVVAGVGSSGTWTKVSKYAENNIWDWTRSGTSFGNSFDNAAFSDSDNLVSIIAAGDTSAITDMHYMFYNCQSLISICLFDTSAVTSMNHTFAGCTSLKSVPLFDTSSVTDMGCTFYKCMSLESVPLFDTSAATGMGMLFKDCTSLKTIPLFDTSSATSIYEAFMNCTKVESGALALYQQASTQATPPTHTRAFKNCGNDTTTGAAELAQIPTSWGGTAAG